MEDKKEMEIYEPNWEKCQYCECSYYEHDTGYSEYSCGLWDGEDSCYGGDIGLGCPLAFKYKVEEA